MLSHAILVILAVTEHVFRLNAGAPERRTTRTTSRTSNIKLQTRRFRTPEELQTWDLVENDRLDEL